MVGDRTRFAPAGRRAAALAVCLPLAGCLTDRSDAVAPQTPLFRADIGEISGGVAPGPHGVWYVPREPVRFVKVGAAAWRGEERPARPGRLLRRTPPKDAQAEPVAIAAAGLALPTPSRVQVTNIATGRTVTLRVEGKAHLRDAIVQLPAAVAESLGADPHAPLLVRLRYLAPVLAYEGRAPLRYALRAPTPTPASEPVRLAAGAAPAVVAPAPKAKPPPDLVEVLRGARPAPSAFMVAAGGVFRVQAGAFASLANARRAADRLEGAGATAIEPLRQGSLTLYRVVVSAPKSSGEAEGLRRRVAQNGFPDAWVLRPL